MQRSPVGLHEKWIDRVSSGFRESPGADVCALGRSLVAVEPCGRSVCVLRRYPAGLFYEFREFDHVEHVVLVAEAAVSGVDGEAEREAIGVAAIGQLPGHPAPEGA